ncbi:ATP-binding protein [Stenotrophomonas sp. SAM-B]|uniref:ATP-binding protein n=1 Tax=Stenotrophomonas sp. SAM-B TaxID=2729141 RepID=UPI0015A383EE|nr:ATP-binding protein [Stenotrophomonas sp. SAM-B]NWF34443.1 ATP-binding protein [Stenotrophomonas sp. SAM-B]
MRGISNPDLMNLPDPSRLIFGLRDTGYDFNTAAADIIDNSIAAGSTEVNIQVDLERDGRKFVYFGDNGSGMDEAQLFNAMRYGAPKRSNIKSLGKFGLGLKTASSSICLKFTIVTRASSEASLIKLAWDLDHVQSNNAWEMLKEPVTQDDEQRFNDLCGDHGTLLIWSKCDRLLSKDYEQAGGTQERRAVTSRVEKLRDHISMIFHRYLNASNPEYANVAISVNGQWVKPWDPFFTERSEQVLPEHAQRISVQLEDGTTHEARMRAWILPHSKELNDEENERARISSRAQGFYIHREGRIIHHGGWLGVFRSDDPHYSLLRVEFDFDHNLDEAFKIDVKKSRILFDPALEEFLKAQLTPFWKEADKRYRRKDKAIAVGLTMNHQSANRTIAATNAQTAAVASVDASTQTATVNNNHGQGIKLHVPVESNVNPKSVYVETVDDITSGHVWEPAMRSPGQAGHSVGVRVNKHHDFFQKIYFRAASQGYTLDGIDYLLWAFAAAEINNSNPELTPVFEDLRDEISMNLKKLLRDTPIADAGAIAGALDSDEQD